MDPWLDVSGCETSKFSSVKVLDVGETVRTTYILDRKLFLENEYLIKTDIGRQKEFVFLYPLYPGALTVRGL